MKKLAVALVVLISFLTIKDGYSKFFLRMEHGYAIEQPTYSVTELSGGFKYNLFWGLQGKTYAGYTNWANMQSFTNRDPFMDIYTIGQEIKFDNFFLNIKHYCCHPVTSGGNVYIDEQTGSVYHELRVAPEFWSGKITTYTIGYEIEI